MFVLNYGYYKFKLKQRLNVFPNLSENFTLVPPLKKTMIFLPLITIGFLVNKL